MIEIDFNYENLKNSIKMNNTKTVEELKQEINKKTQIPIEQIRIEFIKNNQKIVLKNSKQKLKEIFEVLSQAEVKVKDLGKQITYENLFYLEYAVPLFLWIFLYFWQFNKMSSLKTLLFTLVVIHYSKRLFETKYIHIFSNSTAPLIHSMKNFFFYWFIFGTCAALEILYKKDHCEQKICLICKIYYAFFTIVFLIAELLNLFCHIKLRQLRTESSFGDCTDYSTKRKIPKGLFFDSVIAPNYSFEILAWLSFVAISKSYFTILFIACGSAIMYKWGCDKKRRLLQLENISDKEKMLVKRKKILIPNVL